MNKYNHTPSVAAIAAITIGLAASPAIVWSDEVRLSADYSFGEETLEDDFGDELSADVTGLGLAATYFAGESGPLVGARYSTSTVDNFELNGQSLNGGSEDIDNLGIRAGYRGGRYGDIQPLIFAFADRSDPDEGTSSTSTGLEAGIEQSTEQTRFGLSTAYTNTDDGHTISLGTGLGIFVTEEFGFRLGASYRVGETELFGEDVDLEGYQLRAGVELRFR